MNFNESYYFIGKCLGLRLYPERTDEIGSIIRDKAVSWEKLIWVSSSQLVLPALYVQLRDAKVLGELPEDLIAHMENIHSVNSRRNKLLLQQVKEIIQILNINDITPIFLKGTAHLLAGLYEDIGERMIGDIDFLLPIDKILPSVRLLEGLGYNNPDPIEMETLKMLKHYPRLRNEKALAAIEVHRQPVSNPYDKKFNYELINPEKKMLPGTGSAHILSAHHQIIHNILNAQMNDKGYSSGKIFLRQIYDLFLLSTKADPLNAVNQFACFPRQLNSNLIVASRLLDSPSCLTYNDNKFKRRYYRRTAFFLEHQKIHKFYRVLLYIGSRIKRYVLVLFVALYSRTGRRALIRRVGNRHWYRKHIASYRKICS